MIALWDQLPAASRCPMRDVDVGPVVLTPRVWTRIDRPSRDQLGLTLAIRPAPIASAGMTSVSCATVGADAPSWKSSSSGRSPAARDRRSACRPVTITGSNRQWPPSPSRCRSVPSAFTTNRSPASRGGECQPAIVWRTSSPFCALELGETLGLGVRVRAGDEVRRRDPSQFSPACSRGLAQAWRASRSGDGNRTFRSRCLPTGASGHARRDPYRVSADRNRPLPRGGGGRRRRLRR